MMEPSPNVMYSVYESGRGWQTEASYRGPDITEARRIAATFAVANIRIYRKRYGHYVDFEHWQNGKRWNTRTGQFEEVTA